MKTVVIRSSMYAQQGAVLIVALVILLVVTALGAAAMRSASLEMRMANNSQERQQAFNAAETALRHAEAWLDLNGNRPQADCTGNSCYNSNCTAGRCFFGEWLGSGGQDQCGRRPVTPPPSTHPPTQPVWGDPTWNVWSNDSRHAVVDLPGIDDAHNPKYIIEFQCFINGFVDAGVPCETVNDGCPAMYRITALGQSNSGRIKTLLQSVYRVNL